MILIRQATLSDAEQIAVVHKESWQTAYKNIVSDDLLKNIKLEDRIKHRVKQLEVSAHDTFVAEQNGKIIGFILVGKNREKTKYYSEIYALYLSPSRMRQGIGKKLFQKGIEHLKMSGSDSFLVWVLKDNPCKQFYISQGGKLIGEKEIRIGEQILIEEAYAWEHLDRKD